MHQFERNKEFFTHLGCDISNIEHPTLIVPKISLNFVLPKKFALFCIGASGDAKKYKRMGEVA
ncbi:hypothetical protein [Helicobacter cetorum]|uniref:hypothetical protein n=1 Tax=Helicobacter cetorum TaxID=138563 RepID=UPI0013150C94|nr:hypothetical protein [Helicobacter cetorum]